MSDNAKKITLSGFFDTQCTAPGWDGNSTLTIYGRSPGGKRLTIVVTVAPSGLGYIGRTVHKALDRYAANLEEARKRAKGEIQ